MERGREGEKGGERKRAKVSMDKREDFLCSGSKLRPLAQQFGCFSGHSQSCAKSVA